MGRLKTLSSVIALVATVASGMVMAADNDTVIKARKSHMQLYAYNLGILGGMAKGKTEYNAELAGISATNLLTLSNMNNSSMWPQGSSQSDEGLADKTRALPEIWTTYPKVIDRHKELTAALEKFVTVAGKDLAGLRSGIGAVGEGCKGCHQDFRAAKK